MRKFIALIILTIIFGFRINNSPKLESGIYSLIPRGINLVHPQIKIYGDNFKIYDYGHAGHAYYGWGTYKISLKDSVVKFRYNEIYGAYFYPIKNYKKEEGISFYNDKFLLLGFSNNQSKESDREFDSLYTDCSNYVDKVFKRNKERGKAKKVKRNDL